MLGTLLLLACFSAPAEAENIKLAITIDDLMMATPVPPGSSMSGVVSAMANAFKAARVPGVRAFVTAVGPGSELEAAEARRVWKNAGYHFGSHTVMHLDPNQITVEQFKQEVIGEEPFLREISDDDDWHVFRYPFIHEGDTPEKRKAMRNFLVDRGYRIAPVSVNFGDFYWAQPYVQCLKRSFSAKAAALREKFTENIVQAIKYSDQVGRKIFLRPVKQILLLHIGAIQADVLPELLKRLRKEKIEFVSLSEALADPAYLEDASYTGPEPQFFLQRLQAARGVDVFPVPKPLFVGDELADYCK